VMIDHYPYKSCSTLETMNLSHLISRDNWTFQSQERSCHVTTFNFGPSFSVEKIKCPDPRAKVLDQTSHRGDGLRRQIPTPCPHPPPHGAYIDRCIILSVASCYRNWDKVWPCGPPWLVCDFTLPYLTRRY